MQKFTTDLGKSLWGHFIIRNPKFGRFLAWDLQTTQTLTWDLLYKIRTETDRKILILELWTAVFRTLDRDCFQLTNLTIKNVAFFPIDFKSWRQRNQNKLINKRSPGSQHELDVCDVCTLSFMSRSFTMKFATRDLSGAANCSGASWARWPRVVKGVMSCSRLAGSRPLCRGWRDTNTSHFTDCFNPG